MSYTHVRRISHTRALTDYLAHGTKGTAKYVMHRVDGTTRIAAMTSDIAPLDAGHSEQEVLAMFVQRAETLAATHGRQVQARSLIQSFERDEFNGSDPEDVQRVNDLGYALAKELHPNSDALVITHIDGAGGNPHNHIVVLNHDNDTGRALQGNHLHWMVAKVNDELMREQGCRVLEVGRSVDALSFWEQRREGAKVTEFDKWLGDNIEDALVDARSIDTDSYRAVLAEKGITLVESRHTIRASADGGTPEHESIGWTYSARDTFGEKDRERRRKASGLSEEFTPAGAQQIFAMNAERQAHHGQQGTQSAAADTRAGARLVDLGSVERIDLDALGAGRADGEDRRADRGAERDDRSGEADRERRTERRSQSRRLGDGLGRSR